MTHMMAHVEYLSEEIGARPARMEEERQAALYITDQFQKETGFHTEIEDFASSASLNGLRGLCAAVIIVVTLLAMIFPVLAIPAFILGLIAGALYLTEALERSIVPSALIRDASQNVVARYQPAPEGETSGRARKLVLVARYDTGVAVPGIVRTIQGLNLPLGRIALYGTGVTLFFLLLRMLVFSHVSGAGLVVFNVLTILALITLVPSVAKAIIGRTGKLVPGANNNATGVAALLEVARRISKGSVSEADLAESDAVMHGEEALREQGLVPEGAIMEYEAGQIVSPQVEPQSAEERLAKAKQALAAFTGVPGATWEPTDIADKLAGVQQTSSGDAGANMAQQVTGVVVGEEPYIEEGLANGAGVQKGEEAQSIKHAQSGELVQNTGLEGLAENVSAVSAQSASAVARNAAPNVAPNPPENSARAASNALLEAARNRDAQAVVPAAVASITENAPQEELVLENAAPTGYENAPDWFVAAQRKAKKSDVQHEVVPSRYGSAITAAENSIRQRALEEERALAEQSRIKQKEELEKRMGEAAAQLAAAAPTAPAEPVAPDVLQASAEQAAPSAAAPDPLAASPNAPQTPADQVSSSDVPQTPADQAAPSAAAPAAPAAPATPQASAEQVAAHDDAMVAAEEDKESATSTEPESKDESALSQPVAEATLSQTTLSNLDLTDKQQAASQSDQEDKSDRIHIGYASAADDANYADAVLADDVLEDADELPEGAFAATGEAPQGVSRAPHSVDNAADAEADIKADSQTETQTENQTETADTQTEDEQRRRPMVLPDISNTGSIGLRSLETTKQHAPLADAAAATNKTAAAKSMLSLLPTIEPDAGTTGGFVPVTSPSRSGVIRKLRADIPSLSGAFTPLSSATPNAASSADALGEGSTPTTATNVEEAVADSPQSSRKPFSSVAFGLNPNDDFDDFDVFEDEETFILEETPLKEDAVEQQPPVMLANAGASGTFAPVGEELLDQADDANMFIDDADDSDIQENYTETGAFAGPGYVEMPKSRLRRFFSKRSAKKARKAQEDQAMQQSPQEWLDVDDEFDPRQVGKERGGWESFRTDDVDDEYEGDWDDDVLGAIPENSATSANGTSQEAPEDHGWQGGGFSRVRLGRVETRSEADQQPEEPETALNLMPEEVAADLSPIEQIYHFRNPNFNNEVWFVAIGSETDRHDGINAFIEAHRSELRGAMIVEVESLGSGTLSVVQHEGLFRPVKASSRIKRLLKKAQAATGYQPQSADIPNADSLTSVAMRQGMQTMHLAGMDGMAPAGWGRADDFLGGVDPDTLMENVDYLTELVQRF